MALAGSFDVLRNNTYIVMWNRTIEETGVTLERAEDFGFLVEKLSSWEKKQVA